MKRTSAAIATGIMCTHVVTGLTDAETKACDMMRLNEDGKSGKDTPETLCSDVYFPFCEGKPGKTALNCNGKTYRCQDLGDANQIAELCEEYRENPNCLAILCEYIIRIIGLFSINPQ